MFVRNKTLDEFGPTLSLNASPVLADVLFCSEVFKLHPPNVNRNSDEKYAQARF